MGKLVKASLFVIKQAKGGLKQIKMHLKLNKEECNETKTKVSKNKHNFASVAKWYGSGLLTRSSHVRIMSGALM